MDVFSLQSRKTGASDTPSEIENPFRIYTFVNYFSSGSDNTLQFHV